MIETNAQVKNDSWLEKLIRENASPLLKNVLDNPDTFRYQIIYTKIDRDKNNHPYFKNYYFNVDRNRYFNPASMVKFPTALTALQKMNALQSKGIDKNTGMFTDSSYNGQAAVHTDSTSANGLPSLANYVKRIFLISDNEAYNRVYEFCGQQYLNESLWKKGYRDIRITRRFVKMNADENRHTNQIKFQKNGQIIYTQPPAKSTIDFDFSKQIRIGNAHYDGNDSLIFEPMDFTTHNNAPLEDLQQMMQSILFPESVTEEKRFTLTASDYNMLYHYMSEMPGESRFPNYDTTEYFDSYTKFFFFRAGKQKIPGYIRSFNKTGWSYGFLTDVCYIVDFKNKLEFMLSGNIYTNSDGILNDDKYEYEETGYPFFKEIGNIIYDYELNRKRKFMPDLNKWKLTYH